MKRLTFAISVAFFFIMLIFGVNAQATNDSLSTADDLDVLPDEIAPGIAKSQMMKAWLNTKAFAALDRRDAAFEKLQSPDDVVKWQRSRRDFFLQQLGGFPKRNSLNAKIVDTIQGDGYRIEKILFESQPKFYVTANLYLPQGPGPFPAVLHPTGHSSNAKSRDLYQMASIVIAKAGCAVLCYDPIGQGERRHFFTDDGTPRFGTTLEHQLINQACILLGSNTARYMVWDGMRAIDYLQSRSDIDATNIGCTGISGGGTNTSYLMALDARIKAAAPGCYLTGFRSLLSTIGPQDAEQNIHGQLAFGMDHADYVLIRAPQPTLIMAATDDYFEIRGAWQLFRQAKRTFTRLGHPERVDLVEADTKHGFPTQMRVAAANWMRRWLLDNNTTIREGELKVLSDDDLRCTPQGQTLKLPGARSVFDLNEQWCESFAAQRQQNWQPAAGQAMALSQVRRLTGAPQLAELPKLKKKHFGSLQRDSYRIEKLAIVSEPGIHLPALLFEPVADDADVPVVLYLNDNGKHVDALPGGRIEQLVRAGSMVLAVDLRGMGETAPEGKRSHFDDWIGKDWRESATASLLSKNYVGMRVHDIYQAVAFLENRLGRDELKLNVIASGQAGVPALHAAALQPELFSGVTLRNSIRSWQDVVQTRVNVKQQTNLVFGALRHYDLPDLVDTLPAGTIKFVAPVAPGEER